MEPLENSSCRPRRRRCLAGILKAAVNARRDDDWFTTVVGINSDEVRIRAALFAQLKN
jgi:hypothetical protein